MKSSTNMGINGLDLKYISIFLVIFGYYLIAPLNYFFQFHPELFSIFLRYCFFALFAFKWLGRPKLPPAHIVSVLLFMVLVNLLLFENLFIRSFPVNDPPSSFYLFHLLVVMPSVILFSFSDFKGLVFHRLLNAGLIFFGLVVLLNSIAGIHGAFNNPLILLSRRFEHEYLNPISMGFMYFSAAAVYFTCIFFKVSQGQFVRIIFAISLIGVIVSNSRSALIALIFMFISFAGYSVINRYNRVAILKLFALALAIFSMLLLFADFDALGRLKSIGSATETSVLLRIEVWSNSWNIISDNVWLGLRLVTDTGGFPHNIIVELISGFGVVVGMAIIFFLTLPLFWLFRSRRLLLVCSLYAAYLIRSMTSGGLYQLAELFCLLIFVLKIIHRRKNAVNS